MANIDYYLQLVTSEHRDKPNFIGWLTTGLEKIDDINNIANGFSSAFDIDIAIGNQLDMLGQIVGQERQVNFQPTGGGSPILDDINYRLLLKATIVQNVWKGEISTLQPIWQVLFPEGALIVQDNQDMTMTVAIAGNLSLIERDLVRNGYIVPKPQGVHINYYFGDIPFWGCDVNNQYVSGFNQGTIANSQEVTIFGCDHDDSVFSGFDKGFCSN